METIQSFLEYYKSVRKRTNRLLKVIPPEQIDFAYQQGKFTIADQIRHIAAIERNMFAETIAGRKSIYDGCGKELADGYENVINFCNEAHNQTIQIITSLTDEDLHRNCYTVTGVKIAIKKWLHLLAEHEIHHRAQLYLYLNMLDVKTPPMFGLTSEEVKTWSNK